MSSSRFRLLVAGVVLSWGATACDGPPPPAAVQHIAGDGVVGEVAHVLDEEIVVHVLDREGEPAAAVEVAFIVEAGTGSVDPGTVLTGRDGIATARWTLGTQAGEQIVHVVVDGVDGSPMVITAIAEPGPTAVVVVTPDHWETSPGETLQFDAIGRDEFGNATPADPLWTSSDTAVAQVDQNGVATAVGLGDAVITATVEEVEGTATVESRHEASVSAGAWHSCSVTEAGAAFCWGLGQHGALGAGSWGSSATPTQVAGGNRFLHISAGARHTCGVEATGALYCWGNNDQGQLGIGGFAVQNAPRRVGWRDDWASVSAGMYHTCALDLEGAAYCWGDNSWGQLGTGAEGDGRDSPGAVGGGHSFTEISTGVYHTCARRSDGAAYCWGLNAWLQLGGAEGEYSVAAPVRADAVRIYASVVAGATFSCGLTGAGEAYCWGNNLYGQLGHDSGADTNPPQLAASGSNFTSLHARGWYVCGVLAIGDARCWGSGGDGQLGHGQQVERQPTPVSVEAGGLVRISPGYWHTLALDPDRALAWGWNGHGQLGDGTTDRRLTPVQVAEWEPFGARDPLDVAGFAPVAPTRPLRDPRDATPRQFRP